MKPIDTERYQKRKGPAAEEIEFSGPTIEPPPVGGGHPVPQAAALVDHPGEGTTGPPAAQPDAPTVERPSGREAKWTAERTGGRMEQAANSYPIEVPERRVKARRSFDIFEDQKRALDRMQIAIQDRGGDKPSLGEMVQEALDAYIRRRSEELPNVRLIHRSDDRSGEEGLPYG